MLLFYVFISSQPAIAEQGKADEPEWVMFQKGMSLYNGKDYGEAFKYFRKSTEFREYPEAEYWIGKIFENEGENTLALKQYEKAVEYSWKAETPDFNITVLGSIAGIYEKQKKYNLYQETLEKMINTIKKESLADKDYENILSERLIDNGLDKLIYYFRHEGDSMIKPSGDLGVYYFAHSRDRNAIKYLAVSITIISSELIEMLREYDPEYRYTSFRQLFIDSENDENNKNYMINTGFYRYLFFLALSLDNIGEYDQSQYIFSILAGSRVKNNYIDMSARIKNSNYSPDYKEGIKKAFLLPAEQ